MSIKIVVPTLDPKVYDKLEREIYAHYSAMTRFGPHLRPDTLQKVEFVQLRSYNVERMCDYDIILTFTHPHQVGFMCPFGEEDSMDAESMLRGKVDVNHRAIEAECWSGEVKPHPAILRALAMYYGVKVPEGYHFRDEWASWTYRSPYLLEKYRNKK